jgi:hypothetical protein
VKIQSINRYKDDPRRIVYVQGLLCLLIIMKTLFRRISESHIEEAGNGACRCDAVMIDGDKGLRRLLFDTNANWTDRIIGWAYEVPQSISNVAIQFYLN